MYDAIVVGARVAGSPTAMLLARKGHRVLLVDRATFPSDTLSTHYIHQPGVARLRRWGLLDRLVATGCPPSRSLIFNVGAFALAGAPPPSDGVAEGYAPRRTVLDSLLMDAGAEGRRRTPHRLPRRRARLRERGRGWDTERDHRRARARRHRCRRP